MIIKIIVILAIILVTAFAVGLFALSTHWCVSTIKLILRRMGYDF
ncbi:hypothetical protein [Paeniclostridium hominis]|nr:hypothetical protein [Paeniclostridium hominis]